MPTSVTFAGSTYSIPAAGEVAWASLSNFLIAVANSAQTNTRQLQAIRTATASPVTVNSTTDYTVVVNLTVAGASAVTLPTGVNKQCFVIIDGKGDAQTNNITISGTAQNIAGQASYVIASNFGAVALQFSSTEGQWEVIGEVVNLVPVTRGGTGATTASAARTNLGLGTMATQNSSSVSITGGSVTGITDLAVADGGTGASNASGARVNLGIGSMGTQDQSNVAIFGGTITGITDLAIADGGTGASTANAALNNLLPNQSGNSGKVLQSDGINASWASTLANPMTTTGDFIVSSDNSGTPARLASGADSRVLAGTGAGSLPAYQQIDSTDFFSSGAAATSSAAGTISREIVNTSFTPILRASSADPSSVSYSVQTGKYVRLGSIAFIDARIEFTTYTGGSGALQVGGFPFTSASSQTNTTCLVAMTSNIDFSTGRSFVCATIGNAATYATIVEGGDNASLQSVNITAAPSSGTTKVIYVTGWYFIA